ncbi:MAG: acetate--CoA ligase family protein [Planctomycetota bacterium]
MRAWIDSLSADELSRPEPPIPPTFDDITSAENRLTGAEATAFERTLLRAYEEGRRPLYEHEVYMLVELIGAISPPKYVFVPKDALLAREALEAFPGERIVLKLVSPDVVHKTEAGAVVFVPKDYDTVRREIERLFARHAQARVAGVLVVEFVERRAGGLGTELFVGVRATREFGPVIAAGLGGVDTEYLASKMRPGIAVAKACALDTTAEEFFELFKQTAAYDFLAGRARGHSRTVSDGELLRCFRAFISLARHFCIDRGAEGPDVAELEVNPFAFRQQRMVPLDGRGRLGPADKRPLPRPAEKVRRLLEPRAIGVLGVSSKGSNFGRIILNNIKACRGKGQRDEGTKGQRGNAHGGRLYVVKEGEKEIDGVPCVPNVAALPEFVDMLVVAAPAAAMPQVTREIVASGKVGAAVIIPGGAGEKEGSQELEKQIRDAIVAGRQQPDGGPVFLGPNCMGIQSRPGRYDTFFIPQAKLDTRWSAPARRVALVSQSGAFIVSRLSNLETLDPALTISLGNQIDLSVADLVQAVGERDDIDVIGVYVEGFTNMDGLDFVRAVRGATLAGKTIVFYKAGRTPSGRSAAAGHTASVAGDYDVCLAAAANAGALVVESFRDFEQLVELATALHGKVSGERCQVKSEKAGSATTATGAVSPVTCHLSPVPRLGCVSNAGFETVGMADNVVGPDYRVEMAQLGETAKSRLTEVLAKYKLDALVNVRNPLDLTPMATDAAYEECVRVMLDSPEVDAVIASLVPLTPAMLTTPEEISKAGSLVQRLPRLFAEARKPVVANIDSGSLYDPMVKALRAAGVPVFRSSDQAVRALGRYLTHRQRSRNGDAAHEPSAMGAVGTVHGAAPAADTGRETART